MVTVRTATPDDADGVRRVSEAAWQAAHAGTVGATAVEEFLTEHYGTDTFRDHATDDESVFVVAEDESVVGYALAGPTDGGSFGLGRLYVDPERWGEGIGTRLLARVEDDARERGADCLGLGVMVDNERAVGFYEARGYEHVREEYDDRLDVTALVYEKEL